MINNVVLVGRITKDLELKSTGNSSVCNFTMAVNRNFKNAQGEYDADFINCVAFGATADRMCQYLKKGSQIALAGRIQTRNYENQKGEKVFSTQIIANNISFLEKVEKNEFMPHQEVADDDLPF